MGLEATEEIEVITAALCTEMIALAYALAGALENESLPVFRGTNGPTSLHQFAMEAGRFCGGQAASKTLRQAGFLASGIGLPIEPVEGDMSGLRLGTPELVRWGMTCKDVPELARLIARALRADDPEAVLPEVSSWRRSFDNLHFIHG